MDDEGNPNAIVAAKELYLQARIQGMREDWYNRLRGKPADLIPFEEVAGVLRAFRHRQLTELRSIPLDKIVGSVGRYRDFTRSFLPRESIGVQRWAHIELMMGGAAGLPPIDVYQIGDVYFVADGNHRVSVARANKFKQIDAYVTLIPAAADIEAGDSVDQAIIKAECAAFLAQTRLSEHCREIDIEFTRPGGYPALLEHIYTHRYFMALNRGAQGSQGDRPISFARAAADWYENVYQPIIAAIRRYNLLRQFPGRTASDLYVWVSGRILELSEAGKAATPDAVALEMSETAPTPAAASLLDVARRLASRWPLRGRRRHQSNESAVESTEPSEAETLIQQ
jgi:hypothetical protein